MLTTPLRFRDDAALPLDVPVTVRCFAALALPAGTREALERAVGPFRESAWPVRWVRTEGVHVTLKFFGEVPQERADSIAESLDYAVEGIGPLPLSLSGLGAFPAPDRARVLWAGVEAPAVLELLQDRIERRSDELGFSSEGERIPRAEVERWSAIPIAASFTADRVVLFQSTVGPGGSTYTILHEAPLRG